MIQGFQETQVGTQTIKLDEQAVSIREPLMEYALFLTRNYHNAQDLVQCAYVKLYQTRGFKNGNLTAYARSIIRNLWIDKYRKQRNTPIQELSNAENTNPLEKIAAEDNTWMLLIDCEELISKLPSEFQRIMLLIYKDLRIPYEELVKELKIPSGTVRSRLYRARKRLRAMLGSN